jgi:hypothetical protein
MTDPSKRKTPIALAWYRSTEWEDLRAYCKDGADLESTYDEWVSNAAEAMRYLTGKGLQIEKVDFKLEEFREWCEANQKQPVADSRTEFVVFRMREQLNQGCKE